MNELNKTQRTGDVLVEMGVITPEQLDIALTQQRVMLTDNKRFHIGELLVRNQFARREEVSQAIERATGGGKAASYQTLLDPGFCSKLSIVPSRTEGRILFVMTARPLRSREIDLIIKESLVPVDGVSQIATSRQNISQLLSKLTISQVGFSAAVHRMRQTDTGTALRNLVTVMFQEALELRASDIHIDRKPSPDAWISYRIDGVLHQKHLLTDKMMGAVCTNIKMQSGMDASNSLSPQDGRITIEHRGRTIDFRVNAQPIVDGETLALRVLDSENLPTIDKMFPNQLEMTEVFRSISKSNGKRGGIFLTTGPTGSGKTTTLYALAQLLSRNTKNVMTVEDPVEYRLPFSRQIQLNQLLGQNAGDFERSLLRQDPDIIILGEIRTPDTASAALKFSESGHMVLATLHADDVMSVCERMSGFFEGAAKQEALYVLGQQLRCVINQQLVPKLCSCAVTSNASSDAAVASRLGIDISTPTKSRMGCVRCKSGILGRALAHETVIFPRDRDARTSIHKILNQGVSRAGEILEINSITHITRKNVVERLLDAGVIDLIEAENILEN